jgi:hypothetical protein
MDFLKKLGLSMSLRNDPTNSIARISATPLGLRKSMS